MTYTITAAEYTNPSRTAAIVVTDEAAAVAIDSTGAPAAWAAFQDWIAAGGVPGPFVAPPRYIDILAFHDGLDGQGLHEAFESWLADQPAKTRNYFRYSRGFPENAAEIAAAMTALGLAAGSFYDAALTRAVLPFRSHTAAP